MKIVVGVWSVIFVAVSLCAISTAQSASLLLGDSGRAVGKNKPDQTKFPRVYDNDNLPSTDSVSVVGSAPQTSDTDKASNSAADRGSGGDRKKTDDGERNIGQSPEERQKAYAVWKKRINHQED